MADWGGEGVFFRNTIPEDEMSDKSIFKEKWDSGVIASDGAEPRGTPQFQDPHHLDRNTIHTQKFGTLTHREFTQYMQENGKATVVHSDGFLSISHVKQPPAYTCPNEDCRFEGLFKASRCARCGHSVLNRKVS